MFRSVITFMYNDFIFICLASFFSLCVLPTTIGSESTNCDDPYQWYTMHREIKFVMIPDGSSAAPAYSLWKTLLSPFPLCTHVSLTHCFAFTVFLPLAGAVVPWHSHPCPISCPSSHSISMVPQARCVLGLTACSALRGMQEPTQGQSCRAAHPPGARSCSCAGLP